MQYETALKGKDRIKMMLVRPPGHLWPLINESDNWLLPLGLPALAAYLRREMQGIDLYILDCLPEKVGWKSLRRKIAEYQPDVFGVGDLLIYMHEGMRALQVAKEENPDCVTIAGGHSHSHMPEYSLKTFPQLDFIVQYEGEETTRELLETLRAGGDLSKVRSIAYRDGDTVMITPPRPLIEDINTLPMPAYDLVPVNKYSPGGVMYPRAVTIQGARGCPYNCNFCAWSALEGHHELDKDGKVVLVPTLRQRKVDNVIGDIDFLYKEHGIRYLFWVEGTWNYDNDWLNEFCDQMLKRKYKGLNWWAFVRADKLLEQEKLGILEKMVKVGFLHALIGGERPVDEELLHIGKNKLSADALVQASNMMAKKYPKVVRYSTFITGIRSETPESMLRLSDYSIKANLDFAPYHPVTPFPGTPLFEEAKSKGWLEEFDYSKYDMFRPVMPSEAMTREEISAMTLKIQTRFIMKQPFRYIAGMFSPHWLRRHLRWYLTFSVLRVVMRDLWAAIRGKKQFEGFGAVEKLWKPKWYNT